MQVQSNPQIPNSVPNFKAIKSIKVAGLYKEHPELGKKLVDAFQTNDIAMNFCKKYDVKIIFDAYRYTRYYVKSSIRIIIYKTKSFGKLQDINVKRCGDESFDVDRNLSISTKKLSEDIIENYGDLNHRINLSDTCIHLILDEKAKDKKRKKQLPSQYSELQNALGDLIKKSK